MLTHGNLLSNMVGVTRHVPGKSTDRLLSILPLSHMFEQMGGLLVPLRAGSNITYLTSMQPTVLVRTAGERRATLMLLVPQALDLLMKGIEREVARQGKQKLWARSLAVAQHLPTWARRIVFRRVRKRPGRRSRHHLHGRRCARRRSRSEVGEARRHDHPGIRRH